VALPLKGQAVHYHCDAEGNLLERTDGPSRVVADRPFCVSSSGERGTEYAVWDGDKSIRVLHCAADGSLINAVDVADDNIHALMHMDRISILPNGHFFFEGVISPSVGLGIEIDGTSQRHTCFLGYGFVWNSKASSVAFFRDPPDAPADIPSEIWVDGHAIRQITQNSGKRLSWRADGHTIDFFPRSGSSIPIDTASVRAIPSQIDN
jgi:hypothetical protein